VTKVRQYYATFENRGKSVSAEEVATKNAIDTDLLLMLKLNGPLFLTIKNQLALSLSAPHHELATLSAAILRLNNTQNTEYKQIIEYLVASPRVQANMSTEFMLEFIQVSEFIIARLRDCCVARLRECCKVARQLLMWGSVKSQP
jgi:hypothetical protein